jgi:hypothetical protein
MKAPKTDCETSLDRLLALLSTIAPFYTPDFHGFTIPALPSYGIFVYSTIFIDMASLN